MNDETKNYTLRLLSLPGWHNQQAELDAINRTLDRHCLTDANIRETVDHWIDEMTWKPTPFEIREWALRQMYHVPEKQKLNQEALRQRRGEIECKECSNTGFKVVTANGVEGVAPCTCAMGRMKLR